jgi:hypothetical protein
VVVGDPPFIFDCAVIPITEFVPVGKTLLATPGRSESLKTRMLLAARVDDSKSSLPSRTNEFASSCELKPGIPAASVKVSVIAADARATPSVARTTIDDTKMRFTSHVLLLVGVSNWAEARARTAPKSKQPMLKELSRRLI